MARTEVRFAGFGGQGIGKAGYLLGRAAALQDGIEAVYTQEYGPESRGGASSSSVVLSEQPIDEPFVTRPDVLVAMYQAAFDKYSPAIDGHALVLIDEDLVEARDLPETVRVLGIRSTHLAEELGARIAANIVMLGFLAAVTGSMVSAEGLRETIKSVMPPRTVDLNLRAFDLGYRTTAPSTLSAAGGKEVPRDV